MRVFTENLYSLLVFFVFFAISPEFVIAQGPQVSGDFTKDRLCGVNSLFIGLGLFDSFPKRYGELKAVFPDATRNGVSLRELKQFVDGETDFYSEILFCTDAKLASFGKTQLIALALNDDPVAHILIKRPIATGIQEIDFPIIRNKSFSEFQAEEYAALIISPKPIHFPIDYFRIIKNSLISFFVLFVAFLLLKYANKKWKNIRK